MIKSNLVDLLSGLSGEELKEFGNFVKSPFFNKNKSVIKLFDYLKKQYPHFNEMKLNKSFVYKVIFGSAKYNDGFMRVLISNLTSLVKEYLTYVNSGNMPIRRKLFLLEELNCRKHAKVFRTVQKEIEEMLACVVNKDKFYFYNKAIFEDNLYYFNSWNQKLSKKSKIQCNFSSKNMIDNYTRSYLIFCLETYRATLHRNNYGKLDIDLSFIEDVMKIMEIHKDEFSNIPIINLLFNEILLITKGEQQYFRALKKILLNKANNLTHVQNYSLLNILRRFSALETIKGNFKYENDIFIFYKRAISDNFLLHPFLKQINGDNFISIVRTALNINKTNWAVKFIKDYETLLSRDYHNDYISISKALIEFSNNRFESSLSLLNNIKINKPELLIMIKIILLKIYYEKSFYIESYLTIDSFRHLLPKSQNTYTPAFHESNRNFLKLYSSIIKAKEKNKPELAVNVIKTLKEGIHVQEFRWLNEKAEELKSRK
jgi:hypothetical protein